MKYFGGVEGGATQSRVVIVDESGECLASAEGSGTNHWMIGIPECAKRIADMVEQAKNKAGDAKGTRLTSLGLSLSGCEQEATNRELEKELRKSFPNLSENYVISSDTVGSIFTASPIGGLVSISGTGSNTFLRNPDGSTHSCGGWGHFIGDEGGAFNISHRAMKIVFDDMDGFKAAPHSIQCVWKLIQDHFKVESRLDLLPHCYANFDKSHFAKLCVKLVKAAESGDELSLFLFNEAGQNIARAIRALLPKVQKQLVSSGNLNIVCVGSVWKSWPLLEEGFMKELSKDKLNFGLKLITITKCMAFGACYLGADSVKFNLPRNYEDNYKVMHSIKPNEGIVNGTNGTNCCGCNKGNKTANHC